MKRFGIINSNDDAASFLDLLGVTRVGSPTLLYRRPHDY
jgi:hypothetical protein